MISVNTINNQYPKNPNTIILKNNYYPMGLTELDIYTYYMKHKKILIKELQNRNAMFFIIPDVNDTIVKRKYKNQFIQLNDNNYDQFITGRTISIHSTFNSSDNVCVVDIDYHDFNKCKEVAIEVYDYLKNITSDKLQIRYTGKNGFHIMWFRKKPFNVSNNRTFLMNILTAKFGSEYSVGYKRQESKPNLDISSNKTNGGFITLYSLSIDGLRCMLVSRNSIQSFKKSDAKI